MSYFDSKEEIIDVQLTSYGKYLLSIGKLKPYYYAFYDDEILYDSKFANFSESQNSIEDRIFNETPVLKTQYNFSSIDSSKQIDQRLVIDIDEIKLTKLQENIDKNYALTLPLGRSAGNSETYPSWSIRFINGLLSSSQQYIDNSDGSSKSLQPYLNIPQINMVDSLYRIRIQKDETELDKKYFELATVSDENGIGYLIGLITETILIDVNELNVDNLKENFDIEFFIEDNAANNTKYWRPLKMLKKDVYIKNNILLDTPEKYPNIFQVNVETDNTLVDHYLEILVDQEIELPAKTTANIKAYDTEVTDAFGPFNKDCPPGVDC
jgi:hypothetical protein